MRSCSVEILLYIVFGGLVYVSYGDKLIPELLMLRPTLQNSNKVLEALLRVLITLFFVTNSLGLPVFTPTIKNHLKNFYSGNNSRAQLVFIGSFPFVVGYSFATIMPSITTVFWVLGLVVCNFTGFIVPTLLEIYGNQKNTHLQVILSWMVLAYIAAGGTGVYYKIIH